jgi:hypothetical protein
MRIRWRFVLPLVGLILFALISIEAVRRDRLANRYFWWSGIALDSRPLMPLESACKDGTERCGTWRPIVDYGVLTESLMILAFPAFLIDRLMVRGVGRVGVNEVYSFMISMPLLISAWLWVVGALIDRWRQKRVG